MKKNNIKHKYQFFQPFLTIIIVCFCVGVLQQCNAQEQKTYNLSKNSENIIKPQNPTSDTLNIGFNTPRSCIRLRPDVSPETFEFYDEKGKIVNVLNSDDFGKLNPYQNPPFPEEVNFSTAQKGCYYDLSNLSLTEKKRKIARFLQHPPPENIINKLSYSVVCFGGIVNRIDTINQRDKFLLLRHVVEFFGEDGVQLWAESKVIIFDNLGNIISSFYDSKKSTPLAISYNGKYILSVCTINGGEGSSANLDSYRIYDTVTGNPILIINGIYSLDEAYNLTLDYEYHAGFFKFTQENNGKLIRFIINMNDHEYYVKEYIYTESLQKKGFRSHWNLNGEPDNLRDYQVVKF